MRVINILGCIIMVILFLRPYSSISQCTFSDYEKYISENCINCNSADVNKLIYRKCMDADSILKNSVLRFNKKLESNYHEKKNKVWKAYMRSYRVLDASRKKIFSSYDELTKDGYNSYYTSLFYWYYTDKMIEILVEMETTLFGDS